MNCPKYALKILTIASFFYTPQVAFGQSESRCVADLDRVTTSFCLANYHTDQNGFEGLRYQWKLDDNVFDFKSNVCIDNDDSKNSRQDLIVAIDRSQNIWSADTGSRKLGADTLSTTSRIIDQLREEARNGEAANMGLVMFSSKSECQEFNGNQIFMDTEFPCLYVPAGSVADDSHVSRLRSFISAAQDMYSEGGQASTSKYSVITQALKQNKLNLEGNRSAGIILMSDGRTYTGNTDDDFAYLRSKNYRQAQNEAVSAFGDSAMGRYTMVFALSPVEDPAFDQTHADAMDNMCALPGADSADCPADLDKPSTWSVNKVDIQSFARTLVGKMGGGSQSVISLVNPQDIDNALEVLRRGRGNAPIDAVSYSIDGQPYVTGKAQGSQISLPKLPADQAFQLDIMVTSQGNKYKFPLQLTTEKVQRTKDLFQDKEMLCTDKIGAASADPNDLLKNLQGGSGSCGVIAGANGKQSWVWLVFLAPLMIWFVTMLRPRYLRFVAVAIVGVVMFGSSNGFAETGKGINALHYAPTNDGVGLADTAISTRKYSFDAGLYLDYANDTVEIGGDKNQRVDSVMDDLVTAHAVLNFGLRNDLSIGAHVPYVQKSDVNRTVYGEETTGGNLGQPSDTSLSLKYMFIARRGLYMAIMPVITLPTGNPELLLGDGTAKAGAMFLVSGYQGRVKWSYNGGYLQRQEALVLSDDRTKDVIVRGHMVNRGGVEYYLPVTGLSVAASLQAKFSAGEGLNFSSSSPAEFTTSAKYRFLGDYAVQSGIGTGIGKGYGSPDYRIWAGFSWAPQPRKLLAKKKK